MERIGEPDARRVDESGLSLASVDPLWRHILGPAHHIDSLAGLFVPLDAHLLLLRIPLGFHSGFCGCAQRPTSTPA